MVKTIKNIKKIQEILKNIRFGKGADTETFCAFCKNISWKVKLDDDYDKIVNTICDTNCPFNAIMDKLNQINNDYSQLKEKYTQTEVKLNEAIKLLDIFFDNCAYCYSESWYDSVISKEDFNKILDFKEKIIKDKNNDSKI